MTDDFISSFRSERDFDDDPEEELPGWIDDFATDEDDAFGEDGDDFDQLRRKSARTGSAFDDMELDDDTASESISLSHLTPSQRVVLAVLLLLNVVVIVVGILLISGRI